MLQVYSSIEVMWQKKQDEQEEELRQSEAKTSPEIDPD